MSKFRRAAKRDISEPEIVKALKKAGWEVYRELPVDLLVWKASKGFHCLEAKTARGKKSPKAVIDKRQKEQIDFINTTGTPRVTCAEEALLAVGERIVL